MERTLRRCRLDRSTACCTSTHTASTAASNSRLLQKKNAADFLRGVFFVPTLLCERAPSDSKQRRLHDDCSRVQARNAGRALRSFVNAATPSVGRSRWLHSTQQQLSVGTRKNRVPAERCLA